MNDIQDLIVSFQQNHLQILMVIDDIHNKSSGLGALSVRSYLSLKPNLQSLYQHVLNHLGKQKDIFYRPLTECLSLQDKLKQIEYLQQDLKDTKIKTLIFIDAHPADMGDLKPLHFQRDFSDYAQALGIRIKLEQDILLPALIKLRDSL